MIGQSLPLRKDRIFDTLALLIFCLSEAARRLLLERVSGDAGTLPEASAMMEQEEPEHGHAFT